MNAREKLVAAQSPDCAPPRRRELLADVLGEVLDRLDAIEDGPRALAAAMFDPGAPYAPQGGVHEIGPHGIPPQQGY